MKTILTFLLLLLSSSSFAKFYAQHSISYESYSENVEDTKFGSMGNLLFVGASIGGAEKFFFGQSVYIHSFTFNTSASNTGTLSMTEIGPRFIWFLNDRKTWNISFAWHPFAKGKRTLPSATDSTDTTATSMIASIAYQFPVTKFFYLGASLNYYSYSITKDTTASGTATNVSQKYTHIVPMFDLSFRFK
jgi:hypothetical protein